MSGVYRGGDGGAEDFGTATGEMTGIVQGDVAGPGCRADGYRCVAGADAGVAASAAVGGGFAAAMSAAAGSIFLGKISAGTRRDV